MPQQRSTQSYLLPPPRLAPTAEPPPHVDRLRLAANPTEQPDEIEAFVPSALAEALAGERLNALIEQALTATELRERLARTRWALVGGAIRDAKDKEGQRHLLVVAYDYTQNVAIEARIDPTSGRLITLSEAAYQPPPSQIEIAEAIELARADQRIASHIADLTVMAIPLDPDASGVAGNHRVIEILFGCPQERLPRHRAIVDLSAQRVVWAGGTNGCCGQKEYQS